MRRSALGLAVLLLSTAVLTVPASAQASFAFQSESRVWIEGNSNVNTFTCRSNGPQGGGIVSSGFPGAAEGRSGAAAISLEMMVPVRSLDCGNGQMNKDLFGALNADHHPHVLFRLSEVKPAGTEPDADGWVQLRAVGRLTLAGVERRTEIMLRARPISGGHFRLCGSTALRMTDFGVEPPTAMLGLVKVRDSLTVHFDLISAERSVPYASVR